MSEDAVGAREFHAAIERLSDQVVEGNQTARDILCEAKLTNGRVKELERGAAVAAVKFEALAKRVDETDPITKRDLYIALGALAAVGGLVTWLLNLVQAAGLK